MTRQDEVVNWPRSPASTGFHVQQKLSIPVACLNMCISIVASVAT